MTYCSFASASAHHYSPQALPWTRCIAAAGSVGEVDDKSGRSTDHVKNLQLCALACAAVLEVRCNSLMYAIGDIKCCLYLALRNASLLTPCHLANLMFVWLSSWPSCTGSCIASSAAAVAAGRTRAARLSHVCHGGAGADWFTRSATSSKLHRCSHSGQCYIMCYIINFVLSSIFGMK